MSVSHSTPWQEKLSKTIVDFPLWGRLRANSQRGHNITAMAFYAWAQGGLGMMACESQVKSVGRHLYACAYTTERFEGLFIDWKTGFCLHQSQSSDRFTEDAGRGKTVYSYLQRALSEDSIALERAGMDAQDQVLVEAFKLHLNAELGAFDWAVWDNAVSVNNTRTIKMALVQPVALKDGGYFLPSTDPHREDHVWPEGLSGPDLCSYLGASSRNNAPIDFFAFQERLDKYVSNNPDCVWTQDESLRLLTLFGRGNSNRLASHVFSVWEQDETWPAPSTRVIAPWFLPYAESFVGLMQYSEKDQLDTAWMAASHFVPNEGLFTMFGTVFKGLETLDGSEVLSLGDASFRLVGQRGLRGTLLALNSPSHLSDAPALDALRQARAWCGGILSVDAALIAKAPEYWAEKFERREVAALLNGNVEAEKAHFHFYYDKHPVDVPHTITMRNAHAFVEYSLFQENPRMWRGREGGTLECPWGWKMCLDHNTSKHMRPVQFPTKGSYQNDQGEDTRTWGKMRKRWLHTMGAGEAAAVYSMLRVLPDWPIESYEYRELAEQYLVRDPTLMALCEMMDFDADGVLTALHTHSQALQKKNKLNIDSQELSSLMGGLE